MQLEKSGVRRRTPKYSRHKTAIGAGRGRARLVERGGRRNDIPRFATAGWPSRTWSVRIIFRPSGFHPDTRFSSPCRIASEPAPDSPLRPDGSLAWETPPGCGGSAGNLAGCAASIETRAGGCGPLSDNARSGRSCLQQFAQFA